MIIYCMRTILPLPKIVPTLGCYYFVTERNNETGRGNVLHSRVLRMQGH